MKCPKCEQEIGTPEEIIRAMINESTKIKAFLSQVLNNEELTPENEVTRDRLKELMGLPKQKDDKDDKVE